MKMSIKVILLIACILSIIIHFNNASLLRNSRNSVDGPAVEKGESGGASAEEDDWRNNEFWLDSKSLGDRINSCNDGIKNDSDHDIRSTAKMYEDELSEGHNHLINTKKDCILDYVTNEFGLHGARYTDIIKFAYYLGAPNALKYTSADRGYYSCAFNTRFGGHLIQGGKDCLVKGINKEGNERYFALSSVDNFTDYYKRIA